jgi:hypothetical protein
VVLSERDEISVSHGREDVDVGLLGCNVVRTSEYASECRKNILPLYLALKI